MWKKDEMESNGAVPMAKAVPRGTTGSTAIIGPSITVKGEISGSEDLLVHGRIEGTVNLKKNTVTIGKDGRAAANVVAKIVVVEGQVEGDLSGEEQIVLHRTARVHGKIMAPRVSLEDGAQFRGSIEMGNHGLTGSAVDPSPEPKPSIKAHKDPAS